MFEYVTAGESHGRGLLCIVRGVPAGFQLRPGDIDRELSRRQLGYGRGGRMKIERDRVQLISGVRHGRTLGSPVGMMIENRDWSNWSEEMSVEDGSAEPVVQPRPGHADLAGACKYGHRDLRNVLERASARETAARVAAGAVAAVILRGFDIWVMSWVCCIGTVEADGEPAGPSDCSRRSAWRSWRSREEQTMLRCPDAEAERKMVGEIDQAARVGDTLGGVIQTVACGIPPGLGSYASRDRRLDGRLAAAVMSVPGIKGVEIGAGFRAARSVGSQVHDPILPSGPDGDVGFCRESNRAGGLEGGVTNGEDVVVRAAMKPIATLGQPIASVDIETGRAAEAHRERADVCAVPAAGVVVEAEVAFEIAAAFVRKFGGDSKDEIKANYRSYREGLP